MVQNSQQRPTVIHILLDESGSMSSWRDTTITGFNTYIDTLRGTDKEVDVEVSLINFMDEGQYKKVLSNIRIDKVPTLTRSGYNPTGGTAICSAIWRSIEEMEAHISSRGDNPHAVIVVQTDGQEDGGSISTSMLASKVKEKRNQGWQFVFMGCGINAYEVSRKLGIPQDTTSSYDGRNTEAAFENLAKNTVRFVHSGNSNDIRYDDAQRKEQGDRYK